jgi:hypothetical protein
VNGAGGFSLPAPGQKGQQPLALSVWFPSSAWEPLSGKLCFACLNVKRSMGECRSGSRASRAYTPKRSLGAIRPGGGRWVISGPEAPPRHPVLAALPHVKRDDPFSHLRIREHDGFRFSLPIYAFYDNSTFGATLFPGQGLLLRTRPSVRFPSSAWEPLSGKLCFACLNVKRSMGECRSGSRASRAYTPKRSLGAIRPRCGRWVARDSPSTSKNSSWIL